MDMVLAPEQMFLLPRNILKALSEKNMHFKVARSLDRVAKCAVLTPNSAIFKLVPKNRFWAFF